MITEQTLIPSIVEKLERKSGPHKRPRLRKLIDEKSVFFSFKRLADVIFSFLFIVLVLSWLFPIISLLIWLDTGGPVLFLQERVGRGGRTFLCFKFRTIQFTPDGIPRITTLGNFLRKSNIDEFPQFVNVLLGSMSIVGPRPHTHSDCRRFSRLVTGYKLRNFVKPGITGLAQIKGFHGPAICDESIISRYEWDAFYVRHASFWLDIRIIHLTVLQSLYNLLRFSRRPAVVGQLAE
jgi:putative colanic acid biosysnthesis UDP-glucose lipid carrier transferase